MRLGREFIEGQSRLLGARAGTTLQPEPPVPGVEPAAGSAWVDYCLALLNLNEFVYVD
jgi:hypothetical protein